MGNTADTQQMWRHRASKTQHRKHGTQDFQNKTGRGKLRCASLTRREGEGNEKEGTRRDGLKKHRWIHMTDREDMKPSTRRTCVNKKGRRDTWTTQHGNKNTKHTTKVKE